MTNLTFHEFLVEHAKFPFPETSIGGTASSTDISNIEVGYLNEQWKARHAVRDNDLARKLCDALRTTLGETPLTGRSKQSLLRLFLPALLRDDDDDENTVDQRWLENPHEVHSRTLLELGVFTAIGRTLWKYNQSKFRAASEQRVGLARSAVDFHVQVDDKLVALVEAKSPNVMNELCELLTQNAFEMRWTSGSTNLVSLIFSRAALYLGLRQQEWLFLSCHNYWIVLCLVRRGDNKPPFLAFSPSITMDNSSVPFRAFLGCILSVAKGGVVEASMFNNDMVLDTIDEEVEEGSLSTSDADDGSGEYRGRSGGGPAGPAGPGPPTRKRAQDASTNTALTISSSSPLSPESFQVWIHLHAFPNNIFDLPSIVHNGEQRLWLTRSIGHGSTGSVWKCHFDNSEKPFAIKVVEILRSSDIEAQKRFRNEFDTYITMEKAYQSGKLEGRIAPRCYGAFEGKNIDVFILDLHNTILDSWDYLKPQERLQIFKLVYDLHSLGIAHGDLEPRNIVRTDEGRFLLIDFTQSRMHRSEKCVAQHMTQPKGVPFPLKNYKCDELNMFGKLIVGRQPLTILHDDSN